MNEHTFDLSEVVIKVKSVCLDAPSFKQHEEQGTLNEYYEQILTDAIIDTTTLAMEHSKNIAGPIDETGEVMIAFSNISRVLGIAFGKPSRVVENDLIRILRKLPVRDWRTSTFMRECNKLH